MPRTTTIALTVLLLAASAIAQPKPASQPAGSPSIVPAAAKPILFIESPLRFHLMYRPPTVPVEALTAAGKPATQPAILKFGFTGDVPIRSTHTDPPPSAWRNADFDDRDWARCLGPMFQQYDPTAPYGWNPEVAPVSLGQIAVRSKFMVTDPAAVSELYLALGYRGGVVVYLNGKEVARSDLPAGELTADTPANAYPDEAWIDATGQAIPAAVDWNADHKARVPKRERALAPMKISTAGLIKGINVLAVEIHRSDFHPCALTWWSSANQEHVYGRYRGWTPVGLNDLKLWAVGSGATANLDRPKGVQVWTAPTYDRLQYVTLGDPQTEPATIRIAAARNGSFSGQVVISSSEQLKDVKVVMSDLSAQGPAAGKIPTTAIRISYVQKGDVTDYFRSGYPTIVFETLAEKPPTTQPMEKIRGESRLRTAIGLPPEPPAACIQPIWITVQTPKDAAPGEYLGKLTLSAAGEPLAQVPVKLTLADWTLPDPQAFRTHVGVYQDPTTLSMYYKVTEWSEEHWKLVERSIAMLGRLGNKMVNIPVVERTQFGNDEGMVLWVKKADGGYDYDISSMDRYLGLVKKYWGTPTFVALHIWHSGGWDGRKADQENTVTVVDPATGKHEHMQVPVFGTEESKKFWTPALGAIKEHLVKLGVDKAMCLGIMSDGGPPANVFKMFNEIIPGIGWSRGCHTSTNATQPIPLPGGGLIICQEFCYGRDIADPAVKLPKIWDATGPGISYLREDYDQVQPYMVRLTAERSLYGGTRGYGRLILDGWTFKSTVAGKEKWVWMYNRWPQSSCGQREPVLTSLAQPGPDGAMDSVRFELLLEGTQDAEAMIVIAEATDRFADKLGPDLTARCRELLFSRIRHCRLSLLTSYDSYKTILAMGADVVDRSTTLYATAAEVVRKLAVK